MPCNIRYDIIATGSQGNATVVEDIILIDCGVPYKALQGYQKALKLVLLTHVHADHFNGTTIKRLTRDRPTIRFACGNWLVPALLHIGVEKTQIDVLCYGKMYGYGICNVIPIQLTHNVPNCGWKLHFPHGKMIYATDTNNLSGITARHYDLFLVEANHIEAEIKEKIEQKRADGVYPYEVQASKNHLSKEKADEFIYSNVGKKSTYVYMHCHQEKPDIPF
jgi:Cft2 family RNA processing exonuclease